MHKREINLRKFDISKIKPYNTCVFIGKRGSGKTVLLKDLLYLFKELPIGNIISKTAGVTRDFDDIIPQHLIRRIYKPEILEKIFKTQGVRLNTLHEQLQHKIPNVKDRMDYIKSDINNYCFVVMDDCLSDQKSWKNDPMLKEVFFEGRHYLIFFVITMQAPLGLHHDLRGNIDYVFLTFTNNNQDIKKLYSIFGGCFNSEEEFRATLRACTEDYNCLVIDNVSNKNNIEDRAFFYKAKIRENYRLCHPSLWEIDRQKMKKLKNKRETKILGKNTDYTIGFNEN